MYFLFSGEGATDLGVCSDGGPSCEGDAYLHGPMTVIVDQIVSSKSGDSLLKSRRYGYLSEKQLARLSRKLKPAKKSPRLPGKKKPRETMYFHRNARAFARYAKKRQKELKDTVVAVLFRDSDGAASADRGQWQDKQQSMIAGFNAENFATGVPMVPKPKSEAWLLCALKDNRYPGEKLEDRPGTDGSPNALKAELAERLGDSPSRESLCELVRDRIIDIDRIDMNSFTVFRERLENVLYGLPDRTA